MHSQDYRLGHVKQVPQQIRELSRRAERNDIKDLYNEALQIIVEKLETVPSEFGDPIHHAKKQGATVRVAIIEPVSITYVVYEPERVVLWTELKPLSRFFPK